MSNKFKLLCVFAHPDDESLGAGGILAKAASEQIETHLICATRGERGRVGGERGVYPLEKVGEIRTAELMAASKVLGLKQVHFLDYLDGDLDQAPVGEAVHKIAAVIREIQPQVVITFGPDGAYGHPDHIAISQFTTAAIVAAAQEDTGQLPPHQVQKLYFLAWTAGVWEAYQTAFNDLIFHVDGVDRRATPWPDWAITTCIETSAHWQTVWQAVSCHETQMQNFSKLQHLPDAMHKQLWGKQELYRVFSLVNSGRKIEQDVFDGLR